MPGRKVDRASKERAREIKQRHHAEVVKGSKIVVNLIIFLISLSALVVGLAILRRDPQALGDAFIQFVFSMVYCFALYRGHRWSYVLNVGGLIIAIPFMLWLSFHAFSRGLGMLGFLLLWMVCAYALCAYVLLCVPSVHRFLKHQRRYYEDYRRRIGRGL